MKVKFLSFLIKILILGLGIFFCTDNAGVISLHWKQWHITTSFNIFLFGLLSIILSITALKWAKRKLWDFLKLSDASRYKKLKTGIDYLEKGIVQAYLKDTNKLSEYLRKSKTFLPKSSLPTLLLHYMEPDRELSELHNLKEYGSLNALATLQEYKKENDWMALEKFFQAPLQPFLKEGWFWRECFFYQKSLRNWEKAKKALESCAQYKSLEEAEIHLEQAFLFYESALEEQDPLKKLVLLEKAFQENPSNVESTITYAKTLAAERDLRTAKKVLLKAWCLDPQWTIAETYATFFAKDRNLLSQCHIIRELHDLMPQSTTSHICLAIALIRAKLWAEAESIIQSIQDLSAQSLLTLILATKEKNTDTIPFSAFKKYVQTLDALKVNINVFE